MKYILVALKDELPDHDLDSSEYQVWYTGVGKINATMWATMACIQNDCEVVINYGTAGSLNNELVDKLVQVGQVKQRDMDARPVSELGITPFEQLQEQHLNLAFYNCTQHGHEHIHNCGAPLLL